MNSPSFRQEFAEFFRYIRRPALSPRKPSRGGGNGWWKDWAPATSLGRMLQWAGCLWVINIFVFAPIALLVANKTGAAHRIDINNIPFLTAVLWAPVAEELLFRYSLRRPQLSFWLIPLMAWVVITGPELHSIVLLLLVLMLIVMLDVWRLTTNEHALKWRWRVHYRKFFPLVFHGSVLVFAGLHLWNFRFGEINWWLLPLLVLPQWFTGMVLGWMRVRDGISTSIFLHMIFNSGPILLVWFLLQFSPELATT
ncbi:hypothetical protein GCM10011450_18640 [Advenella faeciporci]|uniref:CPBP family intramembrane metalloprotease n=1 Tax=Advenella faeciporci TaxID=797535 RepID=A0A918JLV4_9BURK|nr:CPBP family glutamic-type intramembrane protease [Advenella faeciporci]NLY33477.1 CPBP family intramembrane metalloprotease [Alcaligenaceae bacterium]GGW88669.1 hypothetical protein GCM10011450_18640 [Advenella faeciporci]